MANMIEQSLLCKVLDAPDLEILHSNGVIEEMFLTCKDEIHFIIEHYNSYKQMRLLSISQRIQIRAVDCTTLLRLAVILWQGVLSELRVRLLRLSMLQCLERRLL